MAAATSDTNNDSMDDMSIQSTSSNQPPTRVLVVDDEPNIVELLSVSLKFQGFEVATAKSGMEALRVARDFRPDAFILDVMMPGMDGFELLPRLRADGLDGPVLYLTAKDAVENRIHGLTIGADDYVTKPFSLEEVITRLRVILRRGQLHTETADEDSTLSYADITRGGAEQGKNSGQRVALRFWRRWQRRRILHFLPAQKNRHLRPAAHPHGTRRRLRAAHSTHHPKNLNRHDKTQSTAVADLAGADRGACVRAGAQCQCVRRQRHYA